MWIFISHSTQDDEFVSNLRSELLARRYEVWVDHYDIPAGKLWDEVVDEELTKSDILILVLSATSMASENVGIEWREFKKQGKPILPIKVQVCPVPLLIRHLQFIDFTNPDLYDTGLTKLLDQLVKFGKNPDITNQVSIDEEAFEVARLKQEKGQLRETLETLIGSNQLLLAFPKLSKTLIIELNKEKLFFGRGLDADIDLNDYGATDGGVSRQHAVLTYDKAALTITDLGSTNGTFVERRRLSPHTPIPLKNGALIRLGMLPLQLFFSEQK